MALAQLFPRIVVIATGLLSLVAKLALVPDAPGPVLPHSPNSTSLVFGSSVLQICQPTLLMTALRDVSWNTTRAYWDHGRPRWKAPASTVLPEAAATVELFMT